MSEEGALVAGRYRLQRRVGSGAMGVVWQGRDERLQRQVAVKQLLLQPGLDPARADEARQRAMREGRVAARLHHPHAIGVYDVVVDEGLPVLVMEYLPSRSLAEILAEQGSLDPATVARIGTQSASALAAAHAAGVVHRDIKPANILIAEDGTAKITDFGISHAAGDVAITQTGFVAGTPAYLAPEVAQGHRPTASSDIFSLGATLYAAVEGTPPFDTSGENQLALLRRVAAGEVTPPRQAGPLTPVLHSMLRRDPEARLTAAHTGDALRAVASGQPVPAALVDALVDWNTSPLNPVPDPTTVLAGAGPAETLVDLPPRMDATERAPVAAADESAPRRRRRLPKLLALLAVVALAGVVAFALLNRGDEQNPPRTVSMAAAEREKAVTEYYALLPDDAATAWERLGPALQEQGRQSYLDRWSEVSSVKVISAPEATGDDAVEIGIELTMPNGTKITQVHQLGLIISDDSLLINEDEILRSETDAPEAPAPEPEPTEDTRTDEDEPEETPTETETEEPTTTTTTTEAPDETTTETGEPTETDQDDAADPIENE
ncbi:MAG: protein kinase [Actinophytocola sp.]|nr:protein kinase [Actinophytocola sp.]